MSDPARNNETLPAAAAAPASAKPFVFEFGGDSANAAPAANPFATASTGAAGVNVAAAAAPSFSFSPAPTSSADGSTGAVDGVAQSFGNFSFNVGVASPSQQAKLVTPASPAAPVTFDFGPPAPVPAVAAAAPASVFAPFSFGDPSPASPAASAPSSAAFARPTDAPPPPRPAHVGKLVSTPASKTREDKHGKPKREEVDSGPPQFPPPGVALDATRQYAPFPCPEQRILDCLASACAPCFRQADFADVLQRIKHHFFHREFEQVFGREEHLPIYMAQYLPMRCLAYMNLWQSQPLLRRLLLAPALTVYAIGAGPGSELVGITMARENMLRQAIKEGKLKLADVVKQAEALGKAAALVHKANLAGDAAGAKAAAAAAASIPCFRVHSQDLFDWSAPMGDLLSSLALHAPLSYASERLTFSKSDILEQRHPVAAWRNSHVVTLMFVLNELLQENKAAALSFLSRLVEALRPGALLVVADSAGTFSQVSLGKGDREEDDVQQRRGLVANKNNVSAAATTTPADVATGEKEKPAATADTAAEEGEGDDDGSLSDEGDAAEETATGASASASGAAGSNSGATRRRYWVYQLLDAAPALQALVKENSLWYRSPVEQLHLKYPLKFENMRYFLRIYKKV